MLSSGSDLLTAVTDGTVSTGSKQNSTVSYDEMGNPTRYLGATMTWAGKQLKYWGKSGKYVNFAYNDDGIRTLKNSNGVVTNYYYNGSLLTSPAHSPTARPNPAVRPSERLPLLARRNAARRPRKREAAPKTEPFHTVP